MENPLYDDALAVAHSMISGYEESEGVIQDQREEDDLEGEL